MTDVKRALRLSSQMQNLIRIVKVCEQFKKYELIGKTYNCLLYANVGS